MKIHFNLIFLAATVFLCAGCQPKNYTTSDNISQRLIFQQYHVIYDAERELLHATVKFTENNPSGVSVKLAKQSHIFLNEIPMEGRTAEDHTFYYAHSMENELPPSLKFKYINATGTTFMNNVVVSPIKTDFSTITISKTQGSSFPFYGTPFWDNELLYCSLTDKAEHSGIIALETPESKIIFMQPDDIEDIIPGEYEMRLHRFTHSSEVNGSERGGTIEGEYRSEKIKVTIVE